MNQPALPAYLQNRQRRALVEDATSGMGSSLPAHISTEGGVFTLIDAAGNSQRLTFKAQDGRDYAQPFLDACIVDLNANISKQYYGKKYSPDSADAPICWSANGDVPSREAQQQQARTCAECQWNVRGSATSEKSGAAIKACRDEKWLALMVPQTGLATVFRYKITPGSFKKWKAYTEAFKQGPVDISDVMTRFEFDPDEPNTIKFQATAYIDERTAKLAEDALIAKATDMIVGRDQAANQLPAPAAQQALPAAATTQQLPESAPGPLAQAQPNTQAGPSHFVGGAAPQSIQNTAATASPSEAPAPGRRRRNAAAAPAQQQAAPAAPFPTSAPPANGAGMGTAPGTPGGGPSFGIQQGVAPDPALSATLAQFFPPGGK